MPGITTGTRLEQLEQLRRRIDHEIAQERRRAALADTVDPIPVTTPARRRVRRPDDDVPRSPHVVLATLDRLGADNATIRAWARSQGVRVSERGRLPHLVLEAYLDAHLQADP